MGPVRTVERTMSWFSWWYHGALTQSGITTIAVTDSLAILVNTCPTMDQGGSMYGLTSSASVQLMLKALTPAAGQEWNILRFDDERHKQRGRPWV